LLAGSLASFFRLGEGQTDGSAPGGDPAGAAPNPSDDALRALVAEVSALRRQVQALTPASDGTGRRPSHQEPISEQDVAD
jgi:hypothetical protein